MLLPSGGKRGEKDPLLLGLFVVCLFVVCLFVCLFIHLFLYPIRSPGPSSTKIVV